MSGIGRRRVQEYVFFSCAWLAVIIIPQRSCRPCLAAGGTPAAPPWQPSVSKPFTGDISAQFLQCHLMSEKKMLIGYAPSVDTMHSSRVKHLIMWSY